MSIEQKIVELIAKIEGGITTHSPEAIRIALAIVRIEAVFTLAICLVTLLGAAISARLLWVWWKKKDIGYTTAELRCGVTIFGGGLGGIAAIIALGYLFQARLWMALVDPRLALAYDVMKQVLGK